MKKILLMITLFFSNTLLAEKLDYHIENGKFKTSEGIIPNGCIAQLMTELNGDNSVAAIFINRNSLRGCIASNFPYPGGDENQINYEIVNNIGSDKYNLKVCAHIPEGSIGKSCDQITVQFVNRLYQTPERSLQVLSLEKIGEW